MGRCCAVISCSKKGSDGVALFRVPSPEKINHDEWIKFLANANADYMWVPVPKMVVCSSHFPPDMTKKHGLSVRAEPHACPTILFPREENSTVCPDNSFGLEPMAVEAPDIPFAPDNSDKENIIVELETQLLHKDSEFKKLKEENEMLKSKLTMSRKKRRNLKLKCERVKKQRTDVSVESESKNETDDKIPMIAEFVERENLNRNAPYSEAMKGFSFKLHYYTPRGYEFLRNQVPIFPSKQTLNRWNKHVNAEPGFLSDSFAFARKLQEESEYEILFAVSLDEMYMRKQIVSDGDGLAGYTDYGGVIVNEEAEKEAKTALFLMASTINGKHKFPIGYFLTSGLNADGLSRIINEALSLMHAANCRVLTITFDGLQANLSAMKKLGADLDPLSDKFKPYISHPTTSQKVYLILDVCHMMKLLRNLWKKYGLLVIDNGDEPMKEIRWSYINKLQRVQDECGLKVANKLSTRHVAFENEKMKTKLCLQTLSNSVAVALGVCRQLGVEGFEDSASTEEFLTIVNRLFDVLNSKPNGTGYKAPLRPSNLAQWKDVFSECKTYLTSLKVYEKGAAVGLLKTKRCMAIKGLLVTIHSVEMIMTEVVCSPNCDLKYLPTFKLSQDMIETFFSAIRARFGNNNNPNAKQLKWAVRAVLCMHADAIKTGNAVPQEELLTRVCALGGINAITDSSDAVPIETENGEDDEYGDELMPTDMNSLLANIVAYISGFVGKNLCRKLSCSNCVCALMASNEDVPHIAADTVLIMERDNGGLFLPSFALINACKVAETVIRKMQTEGLRKMTKSESKQKIVEACRTEGIFENLQCEGKASIHTEGLLVKISELYSTIRFHHIGRVATSKLHPTSNRSKCTNLVQFKGN